MNIKLLKELINIWKSNVSKNLSEGAVKEMTDEISVSLLTLKLGREEVLPDVRTETMELLADKLIGQIVNVANDLLEEMFDKGLMLDIFECYPDETLDLEEIFKVLHANEDAIKKYVPGVTNLINKYDDWENELSSCDLFKYVERN